MPIDKILEELKSRLDPKARQYDDKTLRASGSLKHVPRILCASGFSMSVQTGAVIYCTPRDSIGPWETVEVGYPSERLEALMPFIEDARGDPTKTVYGYVPIGIVAEIVRDFGGFAKAAT